MFGCRAPICVGEGIPESLSNLPNNTSLKWPLAKFNSDDVIMSICMGNTGCREVGPASGEPSEECLYSELTPGGYSGETLGGVDGKVWPSLQLLRDKVPGNGEAQKHEGVKVYGPPPYNRVL